MHRKLVLVAILAFLPYEPGLADPIHAVADGAYWHHDSGWVFPEKIGDYVRVGIPQDVAGSEDAVAYYARVENGIRSTASVDVYRAASAAAGELEARAAGTSSDTAFPVNASRALSANRQVSNADTSAPVAVYFIDAGDWRVRIRATGSSLEAMDVFVRDQRWETLGNH
jgi:hypothetical protein